MVGRVLVLLVAALLTMGAVVPEGAPPYIAPDRTDARTALDRLTAEALRPTASTTEVRAVAAASAPALAAVSPEPARVARWWSRLTPAARGVLVTTAPGIVGNLEGVPYAVRDAANRAVLRDRIAAVERRLASGAGRGEAVLLATRLRTFEQVAAALHRTPGGPPRSLITLDAESGDRAAVAIGDLDTADYVDFLVPGMYFSVEDQMVDWTDTAAAIQSQQRAWLSRFRDARSSAVVSWIGYRTPDVFSVATFGLAQSGAARLADAVNGLKQQRTGSEPYVAVLAHSYGATAALLALKAHAFSVDALALVGAAGSPARSVHELAVPADDVFVGEAVWDGVATSGFFGTDPAAPSYGALPLGTTGGRDPVSGAALRPAVGHNGYFAPGSESMRNLALVGIDRGGEVTSGVSAASGALALDR